MLKAAWFLSHPIQYFSPLLRMLSKKTDLQVFYYSDASVKGNMDKGFGVSVKWDTDLLGGYAYQFIRNYVGSKPLNNGWLDVFNPGVIKKIWQLKGTVMIVNGWSYSSDWMVIFFSRLLGRKVWLRAENPQNQELKKGGFTLFLKKIFLKNILFRFFISKCLYIGTESRKFFEYYGVDSTKLIYTPYSVDNDFFGKKAAELKGKEPDIKKRLGLPEGKKIILFAGKYIRKKNPLDLLRAFQMLGNESYALVMVGEGELRGDMEKFIREKKLKDVYLTGFVNQMEISDYYAITDVFVMCSGMGETWGLAVNEAMNFGKPVIVSDTCGCSADLVKPGKNGFIFPEGDIRLLADYIKETLENEAFRTAAGICSAGMIRDYSMEIGIDNISGQLINS